MLGFMDETSPTPPTLARLFLGLLPDEATAQAIDDYRGTWDWPAGTSPVPQDRLHVTLHFLGELPRAQMGSWVQGLNVPFEPFELRLQQPDLWSGHIAVLRPGSVPRALAELHERLGLALQGLGLPLLRQAFTPHVTLAYQANGLTLPHWRADIPWQVGGYALIESMPVRPTYYDAVYRYP